MVANDRDNKRRELEALIKDVTSLEPVMKVDDALRPFGLHDVSDSFVTVCSRLPGSPERLASLVLDLSEAPDPAGALVNFAKFIEVSGASDAFLETVAAGRPLREILATIFGCSQYMADIITRNPGYLYWLIEQSTLETEDSVEAFVEELERDAANFQSIDEKLHAVRRFHRRQLLKIGVKDLLGLADVAATGASLSDLADAIVQVVMAVHWSQTLGEHEPRSGFAVVAMGKLGGHELNYSSDIDLIYVCDDVDDDRFNAYTKLSRKLTGALSDVTREGYLYRVDLRLRPDGSVGPLVNNLTAMRIYYENRGRPWEFQAMLKARVIAGDREIGKRFLEHLSGLVFNPSLSYSPVEAVSLMRMQIRENISEKERALNIKLMEGGIRDIEFIVQVLQLMYGNKKPNVRTSNSLDGLAALSAAGLIKDVERETLVEAYAFFRVVEHRLQMMHQLQAHSIPESLVEIERLAGRVSHGPLGRFTPAEFLERLTALLTQVRLLSDSFFSGQELHEAAALLLLPSGDEVVAHTLADHGIDNTSRAHGIIQNLAYGSFPDLVDRNTRASFQALLPELLDMLPQTGDADQSLINFSNLANATRSVSPFYQFLTSAAGARDRIFKLVGTSTLLTNRLCVNIDALDGLLEDPRSVADTAYEAVNWSVLLAGGDATLLQRNVARAADLAMLGGWFIDAGEGGFPSSLCAAIGASTRHLVSSALTTLLEGESDVAVVALGSNAVGEPRVGSDVDLLVVTRGQHHEQITRRLHSLNQTLSQGPGLKLDYRLRGEGANAPLVQDLAYYEKYFESRMSAWERIAFAKCAFWWGDEKLGAEFVDRLKPHLCKPLTDADVKDVTRTRKRLEGMADAKSAAFETKRSAGGRYDIEYLTWLGLVLGGESFDPGLPTPDRIERLAAHNVISSEQGQQLRSAFELYTALDYAIDLQSWPLPKTTEQKEKLSLYIDRTLALMGVDGALFSPGAAQAMKQAKKTVRGVYEAVVKKC